MRQLMTGFIKLSNLKAHSYKIITMNTRIKFYLKAALVISFYWYCFYLEVLRGKLTRKSRVWKQNTVYVLTQVHFTSVHDINRVKFAVHLKNHYRLPTQAFSTDVIVHAIIPPQLLFKLISRPLCTWSVNNFAIIATLLRGWELSSTIANYDREGDHKSRISIYIFYGTQTSICTRP